MAMHRLRESSGFSLIEIMVAMVIFAIGVLGLMGMFPLATRNLDQGAGTTRALTLAQAKMEELENAHEMLRLAPGTTADTLAGGHIRQWTVTGDTPLPGMTSVLVEVLWDEGDIPHRVSLSTSLISGHD